MIDERTGKSRTLGANLLLALLGATLPLLVLELALRPFADLSPEVSGVRRTTIFERDAELGWKLVPGATDVWLGVKVRINGKGLRGPELSYAKPTGVRRILYLGDSIPFGYRVPRHEQTFPYIVESMLNRREEGRVETINAGVGGYSPWQEYLYLAREGIRYQPDLVVVSFVLNDVTEKFDLIRFGGSSEGFQLARSLHSYLERMLAKTAIGHLGRRLVARIRYGEDRQRGAKELEDLLANDLALAPDRPEVRRAWKITIESLDRIFDFCDRRGIPSALVVFPYQFQFEDIDALAAPQREIARYAAKRDIPLADLLPRLAARMLRREEEPSRYFLDQNHPNVQGHAFAARAVVEMIRDQRLLERDRRG